MLSKALEWTSVSTGAPFWGNLEVSSFLRALKKEKKHPEKF